jgi:hypothetical protein
VSVRAKTSIKLAHTLFATCADFLHFGLSRSRFCCANFIGLTFVCAFTVGGVTVDFLRDVRPIFEEHCFDCHGEEKQKSRLRLDSTVGIMRGGESGEPLFLSGMSGESYLMRKVTSQNEKEVMPPEGKRLSTEQVATLRSWIDEGAKLPGAEEARAELKPKTNHWSLQPVKRKGGHGIDDFVLEKLKDKGLTMSPPADKALLIRRLYLVMHGMPPTPQEVAFFLNDTLPDAYPRLVDRVLASPRYGERWARHWMDVVRYADTNGFETNRERMTAFHYRDYLVESLNMDKPYDDFIKEQLAGDALGADAATGFLVAGAYDVVRGDDKMLNEMLRQDELADMVNTTSTAFLGLTMGCARCHNHKFDPILQKDYYSMQAVFSGVTHGERPLRKAHAAKEIAVLDAEMTAKNMQLESFRKKAALSTIDGKLRMPVNAKLNEEKFTALEAVAVKFTILATNSAEPCLDELEIYDEAGHNLALTRKQDASGTLPRVAIHKLEHINDAMTGNDHSWISNTAGRGWIRIDLPGTSRITRIVWSRDREGKFTDRVATHYKIEALVAPEQWKTIASSDDRQPFQGNTDPKAFLAQLSPPDAEAARKLQLEIDDLKSRIASASDGTKGWAGTFSQPGKTHRLYRGDPLQKREVVAPDTLSLFDTLGLSAEEPEQRRRVKLAEWIASPQNPLTARVLVNRLWHYNFGHGIVDTPSDFGTNGSRPTHPELLDWLANEFVKSGWSIKHMQRLILLSAAFQQSSSPRAGAAKVDADGLLLWRYTPRRLEAEAIRDSMLEVSGALDLKMGGPGFYLMDVVNENVMHYFPKEKYTPAEFRRMVYQFRIRQTSDSVFSSLDCPDGGSVIPRRSRSNTPLQALNLFNSTFVLQQSDILAERLRAEAGDQPEAQAGVAFRLFYARPPDAFERGHSAAMIREHGLQSFARALYNTSEFLFIF